MVAFNRWNITARILHIRNSCVCHDLSLIRAMTKVDITGGRTVRTAEIEHQLAVNEHPEVVVAGEFKYLVYAVDLTVLSESERDIHPHAEAVVLSLFVLTA